jgi:hypothetical protein
MISSTYISKNMVMCHSLHSQYVCSSQWLSHQHGQDPLFPHKMCRARSVVLCQTNRNIATFPCIYLGLPLNVRNPSRAKLQSLIQKIANRLPGWKSGFFSYPGREMLVKVVLSAMPIYFLMVYKLPQWAISNIDRFMKSFVWRGKSPYQC